MVDETDEELNGALDAIEANAMALGMLLAAEQIYKAVEQVIPGLEAVQKAVSEVSHEAQALIDKHRENKYGTGI